MPCWAGVALVAEADGERAGLVADGLAVRGDALCRRVRVRVLVCGRGTRAMPTLMGGWVQDPAAAELQVSAGGKAAKDGEDTATAERDRAGADPRVR